MTDKHMPAKAYLRSKILNASPMALIIILYEGAIASCAKALELFGPGRRNETCEALIRAQNMIRELRNSLDMSRGEIAQGLYRLYGYMIQQLVQANVQRSRENVERVVQMLTELKQTWLEAVEKGGEAALKNQDARDRITPASPSDNYLSIIT